MMNKKGSLVLRDIVFMMMMVSAIFVFAGLFVSDMASNYANTNMSNEWALSETNNLSDSMFEDTYSDLETESDNMETDNLLSLIGGALDSIGGIIKMVVLAPNTIGTLVGGTLADMNVPSAIHHGVGILITGLLYAIILFSIIAAFLKGGKI